MKVYSLIICVWSLPGQVDVSSKVQERGGGRSQAWSRSNPIGGGWLKMVWSHAQILTFLSFSLLLDIKCKRVKIAVNLEVLWFVALSHISNQICPSSNFQPSLSVCVPVWLIGATKTHFQIQFLIAISVDANQIRGWMSASKWVRFVPWITLPK